MPDNLSFRVNGTADGQIFRCLLLRLPHPCVLSPGVRPPRDTGGGGTRASDGAGGVRADHRLLLRVICAVIPDTRRSKMAGLKLYPLGFRDSHFEVSSYPRLLRILLWADESVRGPGQRRRDGSIPFETAGHPLPAPGTPMRMIRMGIWICFWGTASIKRDSRAAFTPRGCLSFGELPYRDSPEASPFGL